MNDTPQDQIMTDKFLTIFYSNCQVVPVSYMANGAIWQWAQDESWLMSPKTFSDYNKWLETLPPLIKELL